MTTRRTLSLGLLTLALSASCFVLGAQSHAEEGGRIPRAVAEAVKSLFPKAALKGMDDEHETIVLYEVELVEGDRTFKALLSSDGKLIEVEDEVAVDALPAAVREAVAKAGGKISEAERLRVHGEIGVIAHKSAKTLYEVEAKVGKREREYLISEDGKILETEDDDDDDVDDDDGDDEDDDDGEDEDDDDDDGDGDGDDEDEDDEDDDE